MTETIKINNDTWIRRSEIRYLSPLSEADKTKAGERYGIDGASFKTRLVMADKSLRLIRESIGELNKDQGLAVIAIAPGKWVPAANITAARNFTEADANKAREKGVEIDAAFIARVETTAGQVLSTENAQIVMEKAGVALQKTLRRDQVQNASEAGPESRPPNPGKG